MCLQILLWLNYWILQKCVIIIIVTFWTINVGGSHRANEEPSSIFLPPVGFSPPFHLCSLFSWQKMFFEIQKTIIFSKLKKCFQSLETIPWSHRVPPDFFPFSSLSLSLRLSSTKATLAIWCRLSDISGSKKKMFSKKRKFQKWKYFRDELRYASNPPWTLWNYVWQLFRYCLEVFFFAQNHYIPFSPNFTKLKDKMK